MATTQELLLIEKCRLGESAAFKQLMQIYRKQLFSYLYRMCGNRVDAEDLFQVVLIKVWKGINNYSERQKFSSWLFSIAHNTAMDYIRKKRKEPMRVEIEPDELCGNSDSFTMLIESELKERIYMALEKLTVKQKEVFLLRISGGFTFKEIAAITREPINTALSHMNYSIKKIRKYLSSENE